MPILTGITRPDRYNEPLYGYAGIYKLSYESSLPYFCALLPLDRLVDEIKTAEELPPSLDNAWSLAELYQREIDRDRIEKSMVRGYLADPGKLKFFNALTVALMPKHDSGQLLASFDESPTGQPPIPWNGNDETDSQFANQAAQRVEFGGVQYVTLGDSARLRWNKDSVQAVAVDGQHRLVSLKVYKDKIRRGTFTTDELETKVPVIFLLLDSKAGLKTSAGKSIKNLAREIFTDLNKNARKVEKARELVLDDLNLVARCVRTLVTNDTAKDSVAELPLTLVRWQDSNNRFDQEYYLNSLVHLESLVDLVLDISEPRDPMDEESVADFIRSVEYSLVDGQSLLNSDGKSLQQAYKDECIGEDEQPFAPFNRLPGPFLSAAVDKFKERHKWWIMDVLTKHSPYADLLTYARKHNLIEGEFGKYFSQTNDHKNTLRQEKGEDWYVAKIAKFRDDLACKKSNLWSFKAIFQKAMIRMARVIAIDYKNQDPKLGTIDAYVDFLNVLYVKGFLNVECKLSGHKWGLWTFIALTPGTDKIKVAKVVEDRLTELLRLWYYIHRARVCGNLDELSPRQALVFMEKDSHSISWPGCADAVAVLFKALDAKTFFEEETDDKKRKEKQRDRLAAVLGLGLNLTQTSVVQDQDSV